MIHYLILIFFLEVSLFLLIVYTLIKADKWIKEKCTSIESKTPTLMDAFHGLRDSLKTFNNEIANKFTVKPFDRKEIEDFIKKALFASVKLLIPGFGVKKRILAFKFVLRVLKNRKRILATLLGN